MSEAVGLVIFVMVTLILFASLIGVVSVLNASVNQQAAQIGSEEAVSTLLTAGGPQFLAPYYPNTPGHEADGGYAGIVQSSPQTYSYTTYNTQTEYYSYQYPITTTTSYAYPTTTTQNYNYQYAELTPLTERNVPETPPATLSYTYYTQGFNKGYYSYPETFYQAYTDSTGVVSLTQVNTIYLEPVVENCSPNSITIFGPCSTGIEESTGTCYVSYSYSFWLQSTGTFSYDKPQTSQVQYTSWSSSPSSYTYYENQWHPYTYTTYTSSPSSYTYTNYVVGSEQVPYTYMASTPNTYTYTTYNNAPTTGAAYVNFTVIDNGNYTVEQIPYTYTYTTSTPQTNTGVYYEPTQETGYVTLPVSQPQGTVNTEVYTVSSHTNQAYYTTQNPVTVTVWTPTSSTAYYYLTSLVPTQGTYPVAKHISGTSTPISYTCLVKQQVKCYKLLCHHWSATLDYYTASVTTQSWTVDLYNTQYVSGTYVNFFGEPNTGYYERTNYGTYELYVTSWVTETGSYLATNWNYELLYGVGYETLQGSYLSSSPVQDSGTRFSDSTVSSPYTYWNATIENTGFTPLTVSYVVYSPKTGTPFSVPLSGPGAQPQGTAAFLTSGGWVPEPSWSAWETWPAGGGGASLPGGYMGYNWGGFPFAVSGPLNMGEGGVTLQPGEVLAVPYIPGYEVGFATPQGQVFWIY